MMRAGSKTAATVVALAAAFALAGCDPAEPAAPPPPPDIDLPAPPDIDLTPPPDIDLTEAPEPPEAREAPETSATPEPGTGSATDPCTLLTPAEVEEALGQPVEAERINDIRCRYTAVGDDLIATELDVTAYGPMGGSAESWLRSVETGVAGYHHERVDGLGDAALLVRIAEGAPSLHIKVGSMWLTLDALSLETPEQNPEVLRALAPTAIQRLS